MQGPGSAELLAVRGIADAESHTGIPNPRHSVLLARTGYTGEDGFEIFYPAAAGGIVWNRLLELGGALGVKPCGLGARDTLRMEVCYPLNGADLSPDADTTEAGLGLFVDLEKPEFVGRIALLPQKESGLKQRLVALKAEENPASASPLRCLRRRRKVGN